MISLAVYWGVWLILPVLVDGLAALVQMVEVLIQRLKRRTRSKAAASERGTQGLARVSGKGVSVIIPVYNGEASLGRCLDSLRHQRFPQELIEIIVVNNGSTDATEAVFTRHAARPFNGQMHWISIAGRGKSYALNAGLHLASHSYICNVDCDTVLHPDALRIMVEHFEANPDLGAATGSIEVLPAPRSRQQEDWMPFLIAECEFQEYLTAFWLGRQGQTLTDSLFTLAGAFSFFRREVLMATLLYDKQTVSEDTKITLDIRKQFAQRRIGCLPEAIAYVTPTPSLGALYSQRVRWQRGEIEVAAVHQDMVGQNWLQLRGLALGRTLLIDHTFLFPRLVWTFLFPALAFFGYPPGLILSALLIIYLFYMFIAFISTGVIYGLAAPPIRRRLRKNGWVVALVPLYRMMIFVFRLAGSIITLTEPPGWKVRPPWVEIQQAGREIWQGVQLYWKHRNPKKGTSDGI